jgi:hypothetical protein
LTPRLTSRILSLSTSARPISRSKAFLRPSEIGTKPLQCATGASRRYDRLPIPGRSITISLANILRKGPAVSTASKSGFVNHRMVSTSF